MEKIKEIIWTQKFEEDFKKIKDRSMQDKIEKQIRKIIENPRFGKPLRYSLYGEKSVYVKPYRLIFKVEGDKLTLLRFEHRNEVYRR
ncbi:MAG: type II toxin-antitoxin system RelE/ParE family toxin [Euryarchaeota archaeon]|nr:type II toxin-antitoxin system RelE/ParE family toxin [Euryarchaeota archaeon]